MNTKIATLFGGSGFIGRHVVRRLANQGWTVRVACRDAIGARYLTTAGDVGRIVPIAVDVTDDELVRAAVTGATAVVNLVGVLYESSGQTFERLHVGAAGTIAAAAAKAGLRSLVHLSAIGADPTSTAAYGRTKAAGEEAVRAAFPDATILRPSVVYGPEDHFFNQFAAMTRILPILPVMGASFGAKFGGTPGDAAKAGGPLLQPVYVGDVAEAIVRALTRPEARGKTYELGGPRTYSFREIMELVLAATGRRRLLVPMPLGLATLQAWFLEKLPKPLLTRDQVKLLGRDNVVSPGALGLADFGIEPAAVEAMLPTYLSRFRPPRLQVATRA